MRDREVDTDQVVRLVGGWRDRFWEAHPRGTDAQNPEDTYEALLTALA